jgi:FtsH-binding integral membrane protein
MTEVGTTMAYAQSARPIEGAVATLGVSDRVTFLRKTYAHLAVALILFAGITAGLLKYMTATSYKFSTWAIFGPRYNWGIVLGAFMVLGWIADRLAKSNTSRGVQYLGLLLAIVGEAVILQPMIWILMVQFSASSTGDWGYNTVPVLDGLAAKILAQAVIATLVIFVGLSAFVFISKKDFSFMRGTLVTLVFAANGLIVASLIFGFTLGAVFSCAVIALMAGYILYQTSLVMSYFPPQGYVAAALMLFSTIATLFWYILRLLMELNSRR